MTAAEVVAELTKLYPRSMGEAWAKVYLEQLRPYEGPTLREAFDELLKGWKKPGAPKPADIVQVCMDRRGLGDQPTPESRGDGFKPITPARFVNWVKRHCQLAELTQPGGERMWRDQLASYTSPQLAEVMVRIIRQQRRCPPLDDITAFLDAGAVGQLSQRAAMLAKDMPKPLGLDEIDHIVSVVGQWLTGDETDRYRHLLLKPMSMRSEAERDEIFQLASASLDRWSRETGAKAMFPPPLQRLSAPLRDGPEPAREMTEDDWANLVPEEADHAADPPTPPPQATGN